MQPEKRFTTFDLLEGDLNAHILRSLTSKKVVSIEIGCVYRFDRKCPDFELASRHCHNCPIAIGDHELFNKLFNSGPYWPSRNERDGTIKSCGQIFDADDKAVGHISMEHVEDEDRESEIIIEPIL